MKNPALVIIVCAALYAAGCSVAASPEARTQAAPAAVENNDAEFAPIMKMIEKAPEAPGGYVRLGAAYVRRARETGDFSLNSKAEAAVEKALALDPADVSARKLKASLELTFHRFDEALAAGRALGAEFPTDPFVWGVLADANAELGNYKDAVAAAQKMVDLRPNSSSYARVAHMRSLHGDSAGAVEMFRLAARTADPQDREAQAWCVVALGDELMKNGRYAEAAKAYDEALEAFPDYHLALAGKGRALAAAGDIDAAAELLARSLDRVPNVESAIALGQIYVLRGENAKAEAQFALVEAIESRLGTNNDRKRLALLWADRSERLDEALAIVERESKLRGDIFTADALAWTLLRSGRADDAKKALAPALAQRSGDARILFHAGMIEKALGNRAAASKFLAEALAISPRFDLIQADVARRELDALGKEAK